ncbi:MULTISPECIES: hypothetical protein [unclassified Pseudactinotalea]|uniref:hypothetical protein n=1 Tax=unclassified Pseudactinotalea TaxID=2649176 RepID=UPI00128CE20F|nr:MULTISPECIES: hypothetical protein [unclassified Pseudactinotalea]MPV49443.1 hypothetical protein [Pseudactinotalea sp. HY160]QGH69268.1 hypothetical protein GCE65_06875 [Pseudactinotalea sp. HY158]
MVNDGGEGALPGGPDEPDRLERPDGARAGSDDLAHEQAPEPGDPRERLRDARTRAEIDAAFAEITAELGPSGLTPAAIQPGPENASDLGGPRDFSVAPEPEGYEPPEPDPIDVSDPFLVSAWVATVGGPLALLVFAILWPSAPAIAWISGIVVAVLGGLVLARRLPRHRREEGDDGAVV